MKKIFPIFVNFLILTSVFAQKPSLTKAYNHFYDKEYDKAKTQIDLCAADEKLSAKAQTWLYKGNIEFLLANSEYSEKQKDEKYQIRYPNSPVEAFDAFEKAIAINPKVEAFDMLTAQDALKQLYPYLLVRGVDQIIAKDLQGAKSTLEKGIKSYEMDKPQYPMNGDLHYYYAYVLESLGDTVAMIENYRKALEDGSKNPYVFSKMIDFYKGRKDKNNAEKLLQDAKTISPEDMGIRLLEIDYAFWAGDSLKAKSLLQQIDVYSLKTTDEMVNMANFYIREKRYEDAEKLLKRANAADAGNFVILYNLGVCSYSLSEKYFEEQNRLAIKQADKASVEKAKALSDEYLQSAAGYFEKANALQPGDLNLLQTLRSIYVRQRDKEKEESIDSIIKKIENK